MENDISLLSKNVNDLTVGDALKINLVIMAAIVAVPVTIGLGGAAKDRFTTWRRNRKMTDLEQAPES